MGGAGSGVPSTPEHRAAKVAAGRASAAARLGSASRPTDDPAANEDNPLDGRSASLVDYDRILGRPVSWTDAKKREEVQGEIILNETRADERAVARKKLFTRDQVDERDRLFDEAVVSALSALPEFIASLVEPDKKNDARAKAKDWVVACRTKLAEALK